MAILSRGGWDDGDDGLRPTAEELDAAEAAQWALDEARWEEERDMEGWE